MARKLSNSLETMGLERFINGRYSHLFRPRTAYDVVVPMFEADASDAEVARKFKDVYGKELDRHAPARWRRRWRLEKEHPQLRQGGTLEDANATT